MLSANSNLVILSSLKSANAFGFQDSSWECLHQSFTVSPIPQCLQRFPLISLRLKKIQVLFLCFFFSCTSDMHYSNGISSGDAL